MKSYPAPWDKRLLLACRKCQKKMRRDDSSEGLARLKRAVKNRGLALHVLNVPCMDICPKHAVTVCVPSISRERLYILRNEQDLEEFTQTMAVR